MLWSRHCKRTSGTREAQRLTALLDWALDARRTLALELGRSWDCGRDDPATAAALHTVTEWMNTLLVRLERHATVLPVNPADSGAQ
jgi:hypothetical protein